jgi:hypothetical protein
MFSVELEGATAKSAAKNFGLSAALAVVFESRAVKYFVNCCG